MLSECSFFDRLLCWKEAILASYPFLGLLLIREGLDDLTAGAWAACVSARSVLPTLLKYFFGSESLALLLPRILFALRREARRNFQHGAPSTKNDVPTHAQGRSKGISSFMIVRSKAIFHCYIYVAAFLVKNSIYEGSVPNWMAEPVGTCHRICQIFDFEEIVVFLETLYSHQALYFFLRVSIIYFC